MTCRQLGRVLAVIVATFAVSGCLPDGDPTPSAATAVVAPAETTAGSVLEVTVEGDGPGSIDLDVVDAFATTTLTARVVDGRAVFELPDTLTALSGLLTFEARGSIGDVVVGSTRVVPGGPADPIDAIAGPRTIVAGGTDQTMAIAIATDSFGNPLPDGTELTINRIGEEGTTTRFEAIVDGGLAAILIGSGTTAERVEVFASLGDIASRRVSYQEVPGPAAVVHVERTTESPLVADGRRLVELTTSPIRDRYGNLLPDGHLVRVEVNGPTGTGQLTARTIDGVARFVLLAPDRPAVLSLAAHVDGVVGEQVEIGFDAAVSVLPVSVSSERGQVTIEVGPVLDAAGAVVTDGTPALVSGIPGRRALDAELIDGRATIVEALDGDVGDVVVTVLGVSTTEVLR